MAKKRGLVIIATILIVAATNANAQKVGRQDGKDIVTPDKTTKSVDTQTKTPKQGPSGSGYNKDGSLYYPDTKKK